MQCLDDSLLQQYVEGTLAEHEAAIAGAHIGRCRACQDLVIQYKLLMWDLEHQEPAPIPPEQDELRAALLERWQELQDGLRATSREGAPRSLIPAWAEHSVGWTRYMPGMHTVPGLFARTGGRLVESGFALAKRLVRKGDGRR